MIASFPTHKSHSARVLLSVIALMLSACVATVPRSAALSCVIANRSDLGACLNKLLSIIGDYA